LEGQYLINWLFFGAYAHEFEVKILDVDVDDILGRLKWIGARKVKERKMRRFVYDISPEKKNSW
jgi:adenylate cyclase class 2